MRRDPIVLQKGVRLPHYFFSVFPLPLGYIILNSIRVCGSDSIERDHLRRLFAFMDTHSLRPRLHKVLPLHVSIAVKHDAFTRGSHLPI